MHALYTFLLPRAVETTMDLKVINYAFTHLLPIVSSFGSFVCKPMERTFLAMVRQITRLTKAAVSIASTYCCNSCCSCIYGTFTVSETNKPSTDTIKSWHDIPTSAILRLRYLYAGIITENCSKIVLHITYFKIKVNRVGYDTPETVLPPVPAVLTLYITGPQTRCLQGDVPTVGRHRNGPIRLHHS